MMQMNIFDLRRKIWFMIDQKDILVSGTPLLKGPAAKLCPQTTAGLNMEISLTW